MIRLIEALNYRCLRFVRQNLKDFHVLVGPNASGKTTFLDVISFLGDLVGSGLETAIQERTTNFMDLLFSQQGKKFELAVELEIPEDRKGILPPERQFDAVRYEVALEWIEADGQVQIVDEKVVLLQAVGQAETQRTLFPLPPTPPETIISGRVGRDARRVVTKVRGGNDNYYSEVHPKGGKGWAPSIRLGPTKSALANLPADEARFPISTWLRDFLRDGVQKMMLNSLALRRSSAPGQGLTFKPDGSNLPWVVHNLRSEDIERHKEWVSHVRTALPDLSGIDTVELPDTRHRYLKLVYDNGMQVPSWMCSDGTLRLLALTLPAYLPDFEGVYLIEEPENGIHPMAIETMFQSLSSAYSAQILLATHSPVILSLSRKEDVLCLKKDDSGATDIVVGSDHPDLEGWHDEFNLSVLYASGVLG